MERGVEKGEGRARSKQTRMRRLGVTTIFVRDSQSSIISDQYIIM